MDIITNMCEWIKLHGNPEAMALMGSTKQTFEAMRIGFSNIPCLSVVQVVQILHVMCIYIYTIYQMYGSSRFIFGLYGSRYDLRWQLTY